MKVNKKIVIIFQSLSANTIYSKSPSHLLDEQQHKSNIPISTHRKVRICRHLYSVVKKAYCITYEEDVGSWQRWMIVQFSLIILDLLHQTNQLLRKTITDQTNRNKSNNLKEDKIFPRGVKHKKKQCNTSVHSLLAKNLRAETVSSNILRQWQKLYWIQFRCKLCSSPIAVSYSQPYS